MARTSYFAQASATATRATAVFTTAVDFNNTPPDSSSVLYIASVELLTSTASTPIEVRLRDVTNASTLSTTHFIAAGIVSGVQKLLNGFDVVTYGASPGAQTISMEVRSCAATTNVQRSNAYLWGLVLSSNDSFIRGASTFVSASGDTWVTVGSQLDVSVATSGSFIIMSYAEASADTQGGTAASAQGTKYRLIVDGSAQEGVLNTRPSGTALTTNFVYMGIESWAAGAHRINLQAAWGGGGSGPGASKINNVRHVALEVGSFADSYVTADNIAVSGSSNSFTTVKSFTATVNQSASHAILAFYMFGNEGSTASSFPVRSRFLFNAENLSENGQLTLPAPGSVNGHVMYPAIMAFNQSLTAVSHNMSLQVKADDITADWGVTRAAVAFLQLDNASAGGGGPVTNDKTVTAIGRGVASVIKTVGANRVAISNSVARVEANEVLNLLLSAVSTNIATVAFNSQFRATLSSVANAIASISSRTTRAQTLTAVANAIATFSSRTTRIMDLVAFARNIAESIKTVNKTLEVQGNAVADEQAGFFVSVGAVGNAVATLNDATYVTASAGTAAVVTANPYVLSLGESVKRFKSLLQHGAGLGRGTTSDRDPDS